MFSTQHMYDGINYPTKNNYQNLQDIYGVEVPTELNYDYTSFHWPLLELSHVFMTPWNALVNPQSTACHVPSIRFPHSFMSFSSPPFSLDLAHVMQPIIPFQDETYFENHIKRELSDPHDYIRTSTPKDFTKSSFIYCKEFFDKEFDSYLNGDNDEKQLILNGKTETVEEKNALPMSTGLLSTAKITKSKKIKCPECQKEINNYTQFKIHMRVHTGERPYKCEICKKGFTQIGNLRRHLFTHVTFKPNICSHCGKGFVGKTDLERHQRVHTGDRPYTCLLCNHKFTTTSNLYKHGYTKHVYMHTRMKSLTCHICLHTFKSYSTLYKHIISRHLEEMRLQNLS